MKEKINLSNSVFQHFSKLNDPRSDTNKKHKLIDIIAITICAVICGCEYWEEIQDFAKSRKKWFRKFLELPHGIPSHDRIRIVFVYLDPNEFEACFRKWVESLLSEIGAKLINIDGKTSKRTYDRGKGKKPIHMVSAWANEHGLVLGQVKTNEKSNEITAIPELLDALDIENSLITIDAMGTQKEIVKTITDKNADYIIGLKGNQGKLHQKAKTLKFDEESDTVSVFKEKEKKAHGRIEQRDYYLRDIPGDFNEKYLWENLNSIGKVVSRRLVNNKLSEESRYFITSLHSKDIGMFANGTRGHWGIENSLHWQLDISFCDDQSRKRSENAAQNFSLIQKIALNLIKREKTKKAGVIRKRRLAGFDEKYLEKILLGQEMG